VHRAPVTSFKIRESKKRKKQSKVVPDHNAMNAYWGNGGTAPRILDLGTRWSIVKEYMSCKIKGKGNVK